MSHFSMKLMELRKQRGLSQQQLAEALGLSRSAIGMYETGKREPDMDVLQLFSDYFNADMNTLVSPKKRINEFRNYVNKSAIVLHLC